MRRLNYLLCVFALGVCLNCMGQQHGYIVKGQIRDIATGELLIGATL